MPEFHVDALRLLPRSTNPTNAVAVFSLDVGPVRMVGCTLTRKPDGRFEMYPPRTRSPQGLVKIPDAALRAAIVQAALIAYGAAVVPDPVDRHRELLQARAEIDRELAQLTTGSLTPARQDGPGRQEGGPDGAVTLKRAASA